MFGYVRPFRAELKMEEYETYRGIYCGLCKELKSYGRIARMSLNYDYAFFAMLSLGVGSSAPAFSKQICAAHPLQRKNCLCSCGDVSYVAACSVAMLYYKWKDNIADSGFFESLKYRFLYLPIRRAYRKAIGRFPAIQEMMENSIAHQQEIEETPGCTIDMVSEPFSRALGMAFELLGKTETQKRVFHRFGFLLGRYIYLLDALDDYKDDQKTGNFNPLLIWAKINVPDEDMFESSLKTHAEELLNITHGELALAYELIDLSQYKSILDNIIYLGLPSMRKFVLSGRRKKQNDGSL